MDKILQDIREERRKQDAKWGVQDHSMTRWAAILSEENGEFAEASLQFGETLAHRTHIKPLLSQVDPQEDVIGNLRLEAMHVAAVAVAILQQIDRETDKTTNDAIYAAAYAAGREWRNGNPPPNPHQDGTHEHQQWQVAFDQGWSDEHNSTT